MLFISAFFGLSGIIGSLGGGWIIDWTEGAAALYQVMGCLSFAGCLGLIIHHQLMEKKK